MVTLIELAIVFLAIFMGVRHGGLALGFWGGLGLIVLAVVFGVFPTAPPIDVMLNPLGVPSRRYLQECKSGYDDFHFSFLPLRQALIDSSPEPHTK